MSNPLSADDRALLARAAELHRPLARAARIATANGAGYLVFGVLTILIGGLEPDFAALLLGASVLACGVAERRAAARLLRADPGAPRELARNELLLLAAIALYAVLKLTLLRPDGAELEKAVGDALPGLDVKELVASTATAFYALVIVVALLYQGGLARYFSRKQADVERFHAEIPEWARQVVTDR